MSLIKQLNSAIVENHVEEQRRIATLILEANPSYPKSLLQKASAILENLKISPIQDLNYAKEEVETILNSEYFDLEYYSNMANINFVSSTEACIHYCVSGWEKGLDPSANFKTFFYLASNPDVRSSQVNPLAHFLWQGKDEGRNPLPPTIKQESKLQIRYDTRYVSWHRPSVSVIMPDVKFIAFYLPQFHEIEENNAWWGKGFTEWTNVKKAEPLFPSHRQPKIPGELGYYDLSDPDTLRKQVKLASAYGIYGFCFYFYWFASKTLLETPLKLILENPDIPINYCLCWANENWTRTWDGLDNEILIAQQYSPEDDINFISHIKTYLVDQRYIKIDGKPLVLVYRPCHLPDPKETAQRWRQWCRDNGVGEILLAMTHSFDKIDPQSIGFDLAVEFAPNNMNLTKLDPSSAGCDPSFEGMVYDWTSLLQRSRNYPREDYSLLRCVNPGWDNSPRKGARGNILLNNSPRLFVELVENAVKETVQDPSTPNFVFINAWNEWAEGAILEPTVTRGYAFLEALRQGQVNANSQLRAVTEQIHTHSPSRALVIHAYYPEILAEIIRYCNDLEEDSRFERVIITTPPEKLSQSREVISNFTNFNALLVAEENRGRDIRPFLESLNLLVRSDIEYVCKIHTKKSVHREDGDLWRQTLYDSLLSPRTIETIKALNSDSTSNIGLLAPKDHLIPVSTYWGSNEDYVLQLGTQLGYSISDIVNASFPAGSMYWARVNSLSPLLSLIDYDRFEYEYGQVDGTYAHAIERIIALVVGRSGYSLAEIDHSIPEGYAHFTDQDQALFKFVS
jgi:lipopolysaccharide biosynthesis protein